LRDLGRAPHERSGLDPMIEQHRDAVHSRDESRPSSQ
jgi:hypothetical protein